MPENPACRLCGAPPESQKIRADVVHGGTPAHKFWECMTCGLVYLWPIPSEDEERRFYALEFEKYMSTRAAQDRDWSGPERHIKTNQDHVQRRWKFLEKYLAPGMSVLEIGCSSGFMLDAFKAAGLMAVGIEPSQQFLGFLSHRGHQVFESLEHLRQQHAGRQFDLIVHFFVLEHVRHTAQFLQEQLDLLKPDGSIIAEVPCVLDPLTSVYRIPAFEKFYWSIAHHYYFSPTSLARILATLPCTYEFVPEQRYDLSNHLVWMMDGKPGGQGRFAIFSDDTLKAYAEDLKRNWRCDTFFLYLRRQSRT